MADDLADLVIYLARGLVDHPDAVRLHVRRGDPVLYEIQVAPADQGRLIGREGRTIRALRQLVGVAARKAGVRAAVEIVE